MLYSWTSLEYMTFCLKNQNQQPPPPPNQLPVYFLQPLEIILVPSLSVKLIPLGSPCKKSHIAFVFHDSFCFTENVITFHSRGTIYQNFLLF